MSRPSPPCWLCGPGAVSSSSGLGPLTCEVGTLRALEAWDYTLWSLWMLSQCPKGGSRELWGPWPISPGQPELPSRGLPFCLLFQLRQFLQRTALSRRDAQTPSPTSPGLRPCPLSSLPSHDKGALLGAAAKGKLGMWIPSLFKNLTFCSSRNFLHEFRF